MSRLTESSAWQALQAHYEKMAGTHMRDLFAEDPSRFDRFSLRFRDILVDFSKNRITDETLKLLRDLARQADLAGWTERMFSGEKINITEDRAVLHVALRNRSNRPILVDGQDVMEDVNRVLAHMREFTDMYWMLPFMGFGQLSVLGVFAVYLPELFPTSLRSTGTSFCYNVGRIVAATAPFTMSVLTRSLGGDIEGFRTAGIWVSLVLLAGMAVLPWMPETRGRPLPED